MIAPSRKVKIFGERNTGTNYLSKLISLNIEADILFGSFPRYMNKWPLKYEFFRDIYFEKTFSDNLGWKHSIAPLSKRLQNIKHSNIIFLTLTKNPYAWLLSMHKRPYHFSQSLEGFDEFLVTPYQTLRRENHPDAFSNPIDMWNKKNKSYLNLIKHEKGMSLKYEDFLINPASIIGKITNEFELTAKSDTFINVEKASKKQDSNFDFDYYRDYYSNQIWKENLSIKQINFINQHIDHEVMSNFGYELL